MSQEMNLHVLPFEEDLQLAILRFSLEDSGFLNGCQHYLKESYFDNSYLGWVFSFVSDFYDTYRVSPSVPSIRDALRKFSPEERVPYEVILGKVLDNKFRDLGYLKKELATWTKKKFLYDQMQDFNGLFGNDKTEEAYDLMHQFATQLLEINYEKSELFDYNQVEEILEYAKNSHKYRMKLGIPPIDEMLLGGVSRQNVCLFLGPMHAGKSIILLNVAKNFVRQGYRTLYIDLENDLRQLVLRAFSAFTCVPYNRFFKASGLTQVEMAKINKTRSLLEASLFIRSVTDFSVYVEKLIAEVQQLHLKHSFDAVVLDYSQILKVKQYQGRKKHEYLEEVMRGLSCLARDLDVVVVTAAQGNRSGQIKAQKSKGKDDTLDVTDIADSFGITRVVNPIITITKSEDDDEKGRIRFKLAKNRDGKVNQIVSCETDFQCARILDDDLVCRQILGNEDDEEEQSDRINEIEKSLTGGS